MKSSKTITIGAVLVCFLMAQVVIAAEDIVGQWEFKSKFEGMTSEATMTIKKAADGKYEGTWSSQWGESTLSNITYDKGNLAFVQTADFGGQEMKTTYDCKVEGAKLTGKGKGQFGESTIEGTSKGEPNTIAGEWQININIPEREIIEKLTVTKDANGVLEGKWTGQRGEDEISNMKLEGNKLTLTRKSKMGGMEFEMPYEGTIQGDQIKGVFKSDFGDREVNATRVVSKPQDSKADTRKPEPDKQK
jgi:hypothetical protein